KFPRRLPVQNTQQPDHTLQDVIRVFAAQDLMRTGAGKHPGRVRTGGFPGTDINGGIADIDDFPRVKPEMAEALEHRLGVGLAALDVLTADDAAKEVSYPPTVEKRQGAARGGGDPETQPLGVE